MGSVVASAVATGGRVLLKLDDGQERLVDNVDVERCGAWLPDVGFSRSQSQAVTLQQLLHGPVALALLSHTLRTRQKGVDLEESTPF
jgi:hypothetical protein